MITAAGAIAEAGEGHVTFYGNSRYLPALKNCRATAALVPVGFAEEIPPIAIHVANPSMAFAQVVERFTPEPIRFAPGIHGTALISATAQIHPSASVQPYAVVEEGASIGANSVIGAHGYIGHGAQIGADCQLAARVTVGARCLVGNRVILHSGVVVGSDGFGFEFLNGRHAKIAQTGIVQIDDDVEIGANSTIDRARFGRTWIGEGTKIDNLVMIAHNAVVGKHCIIVAQTALAGSVKLGNYVTIAGQSAIAGHLEIGDRAVLGARSGVTKDVPAGETVWGLPAVPMRQAKKEIASVRRLPELAARVKQIEELLKLTGTPGPARESLSPPAPPA